MNTEPLAEACVNTGLPISQVILILENGCKCPISLFGPLSGTNDDSGTWFLKFRTFPSDLQGVADSGAFPTAVKYSLSKPSAKPLTIISILVLTAINKPPYSVLEAEFTGKFRVTRCDSNYVNGVIVSIAGTGVLRNRTGKIS